MQKSVETIYKGRVQGVGFRYTAVDLAMKYPVKGFVQNLPNGDVKVVAEGEEADVNNFLNAISEQMGRFILSSIQNPQPVSNNYKNFSIKY